MKALSLFSLAAISLSLGACATKTLEGPIDDSAPAGHTAPASQRPAGPVATPTPAPKPTPDPFAPTPIPQKQQTPGVSPLSHGTTL